VIADLFHGPDRTSVTPRGAGGPGGRAGKRVDITVIMGGTPQGPHASGVLDEHPQRIGRLRASLGVAGPGSGAGRVVHV
jgi:hypothetical protein